MVPAGVHRGTKLGPWLLTVMIDELDIPNTELWKYVDDTTMSETIGRNQNSNIQTAVDTLVNCAATDKFQLKKNVKNCVFASASRINKLSILLSIFINDNYIDTVTDAKILGLNVSYKL
ncbi:Hypothetical predicted protein [Paramuricea clavata]|uniref:Uncharacterized protein n=1 Tax=Paramuricea clavata TaxID=317549 RepID=A0A6S7KFE3_PARCT|nr:Hypothetical predicted protein [Paramuricea clavata]